MFLFDFFERRFCCTGGATSASTALTASVFAPVITALEGQLNTTAVMNVLGALVAACIGLVFAWWGVRKVSKALMAAFKKGKLRL